MLIGGFYVPTLSLFPSSFNLGDGTAMIMTDEPLELGAWHSVEIR